MSEPAVPLKQAARTLRSLVPSAAVAALAAVLASTMLNAAPAPTSHWAFQPPVRRAPGTQAASPMDGFVLDRLAREKVTPQGPAAPGIWLRRVSLDLTGTAPTPEQTREFAIHAAAEGDSAYAQQVDRLLASPRFGERMAIDWLDLARYADTHGFNNDSARTMWPWRDWVIDAFNSGMPYNQFITEQVAGDLLPNATTRQRVATGFARNHVINSEGGIIDEEYRAEYVADRVRTLGTAWLGLTLECARCHTHKYDPIPQKEYYRLFAFFNSVPENGEDGRVANASPLIRVPNSVQERELDSLKREIDLNRQALNALRSPASLKPADAARLQSIATEAGARVGQLLSQPGSAQLSCDTAGEIKSTLKWTGAQRPRLAPGIRGSAWFLDGTPSGGEVDGKIIPIGRRSPGSVAAWINPAQTGEQVLLSSMDYSAPTASGDYGFGFEIRVSEGEIELRLCRRYPAYSTLVRSEAARLPLNAWTHIVISHDGSLRASGIRMFVNGTETATRWLADGLTDGVGERPARLGSAAGLDPSQFWRGGLDECHFIPAALSTRDVRMLYAFERPIQNRPTQELNPAWSDARERLDLLEERYYALQRSLPTSMVLSELQQPRATHILSRGRYDAPGDRVEPGAFETLLNPWPEGAPRNRVGLARWLTDPRNPLVARVVVNRFWAQLFGVGLVKTVEDFGVQGEAPSHPELLDWLAREFVESGWDVKRLMRSLVLTQAYRRDSSAAAASWTLDPENRLLSRGPRGRLSAEIVRDHALGVSGLLAERLGGPSAHPWQPEGLYDGLVVGAAYPGTSWTSSTGADAHRRSLYTFWKRTIPYPTLLAFDAPDREFCVARRSRTNTPLQALALMNDPVFLEAALALADRCLTRTSVDPAERCAWMFERVVGRAPTARERAMLAERWSRFQRSFRADPTAVEAWIKSCGDAAKANLTPERAAWASIANLVLNLDAAITKY